jgi:Raf kinase inhibitor-like YbhB/YbcL family protein
VSKALLDTDIYSEVLKAIDPNVARNAAAYRQTHAFLTISVIAVMEVIQGLQKVVGSSRIQTFRQAIASEEILLWVHWVLFDLPTQTRELEEGIPTTSTLPSGAKQGKKDFGKIGYGGPAPPKGKDHRYFFKVYALGVGVDLAPGATKAQLENAMKGHILREGQLMGTYKR